MVESITLIVRLYQSWFKIFLKNKKDPQRNPSVFADLDCCCSLDE